MADFKANEVGSPDSGALVSLETLGATQPAASDRQRIVRLYALATMDILSHRGAVEAI
jgi:hypothetical protein